MSTIPTDTPNRLMLAARVKSARDKGDTWAEVTEEFGFSESTGRKLLNELDEADAEPEVKQEPKRSGRYLKLTHPTGTDCDADGMTVRTSQTVAGVGLACSDCGLAYTE